MVVFETRKLQLLSARNPMLAILKSQAPKAGPGGAGDEPS